MLVQLRDLRLEEGVKAEGLQLRLMVVGALEEERVLLAGGQRLARPRLRCRQAHQLVVHLPEEGLRFPIDQGWGSRCGTSSVG